jgi:predicted RND superfamily exporter protein
MTERILAVMEWLVFKQRYTTLASVLLLTAFFAVMASRLQPDAGFEKQIPLSHPYMKVFKEHEKAFGGANLLSIALIQKPQPSSAKNLYNEVFLDRLKKLTEATFFLPGIDRTRVQSLFTPGVRYLEVVEGGLDIGDVIPRNYAPTPEMFARIQDNVGKAKLVGRLVSNDQRGAMIVAELLERHPTTFEKLDYHALSNQLEDQLRQRLASQTAFDFVLKTDQQGLKAGTRVFTAYSDFAWQSHRFEAEQKTEAGQAIFIDGQDLTRSARRNLDYAPDIAVHIIGFAKVIGDVTDASREVVGYFGLAVLLMLGLLWWFCGSLRLGILPLLAALTAVVWELGLLHTVGFGLDPFAILVPFLILSIGVSHGVQYINGWGNEILNGHDSFEASRLTFRRLFIPGTVAIITNVIGFAMLALINIRIVQEMAYNAALGMAAVILTNKILLPIVLTWVRLPRPETFKQRGLKRQAAWGKLWQRVAGMTEAKPALWCLGLATLLLAWALWQYPKLTVGDSQIGVPELKAHGRYNQDSLAIVSNFAIGVDVLKVMVKAPPYACVKYEHLQKIDDYSQHLANIEGVQGVLALPVVAKQVWQAWNEGNPKWQVLPRKEAALAHIVNPIPSSLGLQNVDCSVMPVLVFTQDHKASTIDRILAASEAFTSKASGALRFELASGNVGVMAATNAEIKASELIVIIWVHLSLLIFVWISFRSWASVVCIITPLVLCSLLTYGFMAIMGIGMKAATLPVAAFGVGIGVDDGIYLWGALTSVLAKGGNLRISFFEALCMAGRGTVFTSLALMLAVATWLFSGLQFQADMGLLLLFMFFTNLLGAVLMMPALAWLCHRIQPLYIVLNYP